MIFGTRAIVTLVAIVTTVLLAACGGGDAGSASLTLTDDDCTYEGNESPPATQTFSAELENQSSKLGAFEIARIDAGGTFADVEAYVESERRRLAESFEIVGPPAFLTLMTRAAVPPSDGGMLVATLRPGEYVLWCAHEHPPTAVFLVTPPLEVSE